MKVVDPPPLGDYDARERVAAAEERGAQGARMHDERRTLAIGNRLGLIAVAATLALLGGCGGAGGGSSAAPDGLEWNGDGSKSQPDWGTPGPTGLDGEAPAKRLLLVLHHDTTVPTGLKIQDELAIRAQVIDLEEGKPAADVAVAYEIIKNEGPNGQKGDASLQTQVAVADGDGEVANKFRAGNVGDVSYTVRLGVEGAEPVTLDVIVSDAPKGSVEVSFSYEGPVGLGSIKVRLMPKTFICGTFTPTANYTNSLADKTVLGVDAKPVFDGLAAGSYFTVIATAKSAAGHLAAAGCRDGVFVIANQKTPATLELYTLPLNPTGTYDVDDYFNFQGALPALGTVGQVIDGIVTLFNDPGKFLIDQIKNLVKLYLGSVIVDVAFGLFEKELAKVITNWVKSDAPDWLKDFFTIGDDLTQIVDNLHLKSKVKISKLQNNYYVQGLQYWDGLVLSWKFGCDKNAPDYDKCGLYTFSLTQIANTQFPQEIIEGKFTASIVNRDDLFIDNHVIKLSYGKLILFVLNEMILKTLTGENTLKGAALKFVNCKSIASAMSGSVLDAVGIEEKDIEQFCTSTVGLLVAPIETWIGTLALDSQLRLSGKAKLVDEDDDLYVDKLTNGEHSGTIEVDGGPGPTFKGTWSGTKIPIQLPPK